MSLRHSVSGSSRRAQPAVARIGAGIARVGFLERRRGDVVAPPPDQHLLVAVLRRGLRLVQALQCPVVPLVEPPRVLHGDPHQVQLVQGDPQGADRPLEDRRERDVERESLGLEQLAGPLRLGLPLVGQVDVGPAGEQVFLVPDALAVTQQHDLGHCLPGDRRVRFVGDVVAFSVLPRRSTAV